MPATSTRGGRQAIWSPLGVCGREP